MSRRWQVVALLTLGLAAAVVLGLAGVLGEANVVRVVLALVALIAYELRRQPPASGGSAGAAAPVGLALVSGELGAALFDASGALAAGGVP